MTEISVGSIIRHRKRGSRYRVLGSFHAIMRTSMDGSRQVLALSNGDVMRGLGPQLLSQDDTAPLEEGDVLCMSVPVMVQVSEDHPDGPVEVLLYASTDAPGLSFVRAASEFPDRFDEIPLEGIIMRRIAMMMPDEIVNLLIEANGLPVGGYCAGTSLRRLAEEAREHDPHQFLSKDIRLVMRRVAAAAKDWMGGNDLKIPVTLDRDAAEAVILSSRFDGVVPSPSDRASLLISDA